MRTFVVAARCFVCLCLCACVRVCVCAFVVLAVAAGFDSCGAAHLLCESSCLSCDSRLSSMFSRLPFTISKHVGFSLTRVLLLNRNSKMRAPPRPASSTWPISSSTGYAPTRIIVCAITHFSFELEPRKVHFQNKLVFCLCRPIRPSLRVFFSHPQVPHYEIALRLLDRLDRESSALLSRIDSDPAHQQRHQSRRVGSGDRAELDSSSSASSLSIDHHDRNRGQHHAPHNCCFEHSFIESCRAQVCRLSSNIFFTHCLFSPLFR
jgi:hypothetical protein